VSSSTSPVRQRGKSRCVRNTPWGRAQVEAALPTGVRRACSQVGWLSDVQEHPDLQLLRGDAQIHVLAVAKVVALYANWETYCARPTWPVLIERIGLSRSTIARHLAWLREHQLLAWVERGTTPNLSPGVLQCGPNSEKPGNTATVYMLCAPVRVRLVAISHPEDHGYEHIHAGPTDAVEATAWAAQGPHDDLIGDQHVSDPEVAIQPPALELVDASDTPTGFGFVSKSPTRARLSPSGAGLRPALSKPVPMRRVPLRDTSEEPPWSLRSTPAGRKERLAAATALQEALPVLGRISTAYVASLCREFFLAGWTPADILTALGQRPDGTHWTHEHNVRHVPGWFRHRLAPWHVNPTDHTSPIGASPRRRAEAEAVRERALKRAARETTDAAYGAAQNAAADATTVPEFLAARARIRAYNRARQRDHCSWLPTET
jgi:hypothetical protein